jgi:hypothetical protein
MIAASDRAHRSCLALRFDGPDDAGSSESAGHFGALRQGRRFYACSGGFAVGRNPPTQIGKWWLPSNTGEIFAPFNREWIASHFHAHLP